MLGLTKVFSKKSKRPTHSEYDPVIRQIGDPDQIVLPLDYPGQARYMPVVETGSTVRKGQPIAKSKNGHAIIASISGTVEDIRSIWTAQSIHSPAIFISANDDDPMTPQEMFTTTVEDGNLESAMMRMRAAGVTPPWSLSGREWKEGELDELPKVNTVIITGVQSETTILTSQLLLDQQRDKVAKGLKRIGAMMPGAQVYLTAPEEFKTWADSQFSNLAEVVFLPQSYSGRIEREVVAKILGYRIPNRIGYRYHGVIVLDIEYLLAIVDALDGVSPLVQKCITISGSNMEKAITVQFPLGSSLGHILNSLGLKISDYTRPLVGGPMQGVAQYSDQTPITYYNGIHLISEDMAPFDNIAPCINCGRCTRACPVNIQVHLANRMIEFGELDSARALHPEACHECGMCAYVCPAERPIVQLLHFCNRDMIHGERLSWTAGGTS